MMTDFPFMAVAASAIGLMAIACASPPEDPPGDGSTLGDTGTSSSETSPSTAVSLDETSTDSEGGSTGLTTGGQPGLCPDQDAEPGSIVSSASVVTPDGATQGNDLAVIADQFFVAGFVSGAPGDQEDAWLGAFTSTDDLAWETVLLAGPNYDAATAVTATPDDGAIVVAFDWVETDPDVGFRVETWIARYDGAGGEVWSQRLQQDDQEYPIDVAALEDGSSLVLTAGGPIGTRFYHFGPDGVMLDQRVLWDGDLDMAPKAFQPLEGGDIVVVGDQFHERWVARIAADSDIEVWRKTWTEDASPTEMGDVAVTEDQDIVVVGTRPDAAGKRDAWIARLASDGAVAWEGSWGSPDASERANGVAIDADGRIVVAGDATSEGMASPGVIRSFTADGELRWETEVSGIGGPPWTSLDAVAIDENCRVIVAGHDVVQLGLENRLFLAVLAP